jgi:hypothetical protein
MVSGFLKGAELPRPPPRHRILARECFQGGDTMWSISQPLTLPADRHTLRMSLARCNKCGFDMPATLRLAIAPRASYLEIKDRACKSSCLPLSCACPPLATQPLWCELYDQGPISMCCAFVWKGSPESFATYAFFA